MKSFYEIQADQNDYIFIAPFYSTKINPHFHKSMEFVYCVSGQTEVFINGEKTIISADEIYTVPSYAIHYNKVVGENHILSLVFAHNYFHDFEKTFPNMMFPHILKNHEKNKEIYGIMDKILNFNWVSQQKKVFPFLKYQSLINDLLYELSQIYELIPIEEKKINHTLIDILCFINEHYSENISLDFLSKKYNYNPKYFSELFNKNIGCNLNTYINNIRLEKALLQINDPKNTDSVATIAFNNGFNSLATFYRILKKYENDTEKPL